jgi:hypothetical protein
MKFINQKDELSSTIPSSSISSTYQKGDKLPVKKNIKIKLVAK